MQANDLRNFADNLELGGFKALSAGIGFAVVKPAQPVTQTLARQGAHAVAAHPQTWVTAPAVAAHAPREQAKRAKARNVKKDGGVARKGTGTAPVSVTTAPAASKRRAPLAFETRLVAWGLDFFFVALSLAVLLALFTVLTAVRSGGADDVFALAPVRWLMGVNRLELVAGVYALFFVYVLLFKLVAGVTLGESLLRARLARAP